MRGPACCFSGSGSCGLISDARKPGSLTFLGSVLAYKLCHLGLVTFLSCISVDLPALPALWLRSELYRVYGQCFLVRPSLPTAFFVPLFGVCLLLLLSHLICGAGVLLAGRGVTRLSIARCLTSLLVNYSVIYRSVAPPPMRFQLRACCWSLFSSLFVLVWRRPSC